MKRYFYILPVSIFLCFMSLGGGEKIESRNNAVLASVNGRAVTLMDILPLTRTRELQAASVYSGGRLYEEIQRYRREAVDDLVDNILIQSEFAKYGFVLSNTDVEREIDQIASRIGCHSRGELERRLRREGSGIEEVRMNIRNNMMVQMMIYRQIRIADPVSPKEIYEYYQANEAEFLSPEKVELAMLKLSSNHPDFSAESAAISEILKNEPEKFSELVRRYSSDLGNGELGEIECRLLRPEFAAAFSGFAEGMIAGPVQVYDGTVWLKVISYTPVRKSSFEMVQERIKLELEQRNRERIIRSYAAKLRSRAMIEYYF